MHGRFFYQIDAEDHVSLAHGIYVRIKTQQLSKIRSDLSCRINGSWLENDEPKPWIHELLL
jgi:hypothetical protein